LKAGGVEAGGSEYIVPVVVGDDVRVVAAAARVRGQGFDVRAVRPPSVAPGTARLRISVHADHDPGTLDDLAAAVADALGHV
jgi:8-amino-7-oxononanoate synthase